MDCADGAGGSRMVESGSSASLLFPPSLPRVACPLCSRRSSRWLCAPCASSRSDWTARLQRQAELLRRVSVAQREAEGALEQRLGEPSRLATSAETTRLAIQRATSAVHLRRQRIAEKTRALLKLREGRLDAAKKVKQLTEGVRSRDEAIRKREAHRTQLAKRLEQSRGSLAAMRCRRVGELTAEVVGVSEVSEPEPSTMTTAELAAATRTNFVDGRWTVAADTPAAAFSVCGVRVSELWDVDELRHCLFHSSHALLSVNGGLAGLGLSGQLLWGLERLLDVRLPHRLRLQAALVAATLTHPQFDTLLFQLQANLAALALAQGLEGPGLQRPLATLLLLVGAATAGRLGTEGPLEVPASLAAALDARVPRRWAPQSLPELQPQISAEVDDAWEDVAEEDLSGIEAAQTSTLNSLFSAATTSVSALFRHK